MRQVNSVPRAPTALMSTMTPSPGGAAEQIRVLVVDDSDDVRALLALIISREPDMRCVGELSSADDLLATIERIKPHVTLLDLSMPGIDPEQAMSDAAAKFPCCRTLVMSGYDDPERIDAIAQRGAWGFVSKHSDPAKLAGAIRSVARGEAMFST